MKSPELLTTTEATQPRSSSSEQALFDEQRFEELVGEGEAASECVPDGEACDTCERTRNAPWTFLTNHSHVLLCLAHEPDQTLRQVASCVGITERAVQRIVTDLERAGILTRTRDGRRNRYSVNLNAPLRHDMESHKTVGDLMTMVWHDDAVSEKVS